MEQSPFFARINGLCVEGRVASAVSRSGLTYRAGKKAVRKTITASSDPDLFFGFRGAGGALGVAIAYTTATFPIPTNVRPQPPPSSFPQQELGQSLQ